MVSEPAEEFSPRQTARCVCWPSAADGLVELHLEQDAVPAALRIVRNAMRTWTAAADLEPDTAYAIVLAVDEAVANVVDHAYCSGTGGNGLTECVTGRVEVHASGQPCGAGVAVSVADRGTWRPPPEDPGHRGRGIRVIERLADRSTVLRRQHGTTVRMCWSPH